MGATTFINVNFLSLSCSAVFRVLLAGCFYAFTWTLALAKLSDVSESTCQAGVGFCVCLVSLVCCRAEMTWGPRFVVSIACVMATAACSSLLLMIGSRWTHMSNFVMLLTAILAGASKTGVTYIIDPTKIKKDALPRVTTFAAFVFLLCLIAQVNHQLVRLLSCGVWLVAIILCDRTCWHQIMDTPTFPGKIDILTDMIMETKEEVRAMASDLNGVKSDLNGMKSTLNMIVSILTNSPRTLAGREDADPPPK